jgi:hypothetical protein
MVAKAVVIGIVTVEVVVVTPPKIVCVKLVVKVSVVHDVLVLVTVSIVFGGSASACTLWLRNMEANESAITRTTMKETALRFRPIFNSFFSFPDFSLEPFLAFH